MLIIPGIAINTVAASVNYIWNNNFVLPNIRISKGTTETIESAKAVELAEAVELAKVVELAKAIKLAI